MNIILGSQSKWRAHELEKAGIVFTTMNPNIDEKAIRYTDPEKLVLALAHAKANALIPKITEPALLITCDQVVVYEGEIREKPIDEAEARAFLASYAKHPAEVVNGVVVTNTATGNRVEGIDRAKVWYQSTLLDAADELARDAGVATCAGALQTEHPLMLAHIDRLVGTHDSFAGMPIDLVRGLLNEASR